MEEIWKDIAGYEGYYQISNLGRVKSLERIAITKIGSKQPVNERILVAGYDTAGYYRVALCKNAKSRTRKVHRLVAQAFIPNPENKKTVNHKNGIKDDNRVENLEWATYKENNDHAIDTGLLIKNCRKGDECSFSKLKGSDIPVLRELNNTMKHREIAKIYNVHKSTIEGVVYRRNWKHIK